MLEEKHEPLTMSWFNDALEGIRNHPYHLPTLEERYGTAKAKILEKELLPILEKAIGTSTKNEEKVKPSLFTHNWDGSNYIDRKTGLKVD